MPSNFEMKAIVFEFLAKCCFAGLFGVAGVFFCSVTLPWLAHHAIEMLRAWRRLGLIGMLITAIFVGKGILYGGGKGTGKSPPASARVVQVQRVGPKVATSAFTRMENWHGSGAWEAMEFIRFPDGWVFPHGTNHLTMVDVWSQGKIFPSAFETNAIAAASAPLALTPFETEVRYGMTNDAFRIDRKKAHPNRNPNETADMSVILHRNGDVTTTENGVTRTIDRVLPFAHDGFGQDDDWVRANFTNAEEIISVGYANWVDAQVGVGLTNGLYKFTASFTEDTPEATELHIGNYSICVTNAGEYVFLLEKGKDYEFDTWPFNEDADYFIQDDMADNAPMQASSWGGWESPGEWSVDGGWNWLYYPSVDNPGYCCWMPTLQGSPNVAHLGPTNLPVTFTAILTDYCGSATPTFDWSASSEDVQFSSPNIPTTTVSCVSLPDWGALSMSVRADLSGYSLWSYLYPTYGTNETPQVALSLSAPEIVFLNDDERTTRLYRITLSAECPIATNVVVTISHGGETGVRFFSDAQGEDEIALPANLRCAISDSRSVIFDGYMSCSRLGVGMIHVVAITADRVALERDATYEVIEPLRKLVTTTIADDGSVVNPSRLTYGTNAWLEVDRNGRYPADEIKWCVVSGPGEIAATNRFRACVRATNTNGTVVVEASFGKDAHIQPQFVLPLVGRRRIPLNVYYVKDLQKRYPPRLKQFELDLTVTNLAFAQIGVEFYCTGTPQEFADPSYSRLQEYAVSVDANGRRYLTDQLSNEAISLLNILPSTNEAIRVLYVSRITHGTSLAFSVEDYRAIVMGCDGTNEVLAHELGHSLGLEDIYAYKKADSTVLMVGFGDQAYSGIFSERIGDWGVEEGRAFYEVSDTHGMLINLLLMNGFNDFGGMDIPSGSVSGYPPTPQHAFDKPMRKVGANAALKGL